MGKRVCKFTDDLQKDYPFLEKRLCKGPSVVFCKLCLSEFSVAHGGRSDIKDHQSTNKHKSCTNAQSSSAAVSSFFKSAKPCEDDLKRAAKEVAYAVHTVKHSQSFRSMDCTSKLVKTLFDSKFSCARTKSEAIILNVVKPFEDKLLESDLKSVNYFCASTDTSGHGSIKLLPTLVRYFTWNKGVQIKLLNLSSIPGETSQILFDDLRNVLEKLDITNKLVALCADNTNTNFGGVNRKGENNLYKKVKDNINSKAIGIGCGAHLIHNSVQTASDSLSIDVECIVVKIYKHFHIYTVRTEKLKDFCDFVNVEYKGLLGTSNTRWLSLSRAVERLLQVYEGVKSYFLSDDKCPVAIKSFFLNPSAEPILWFLHCQLHTFSKAILKVEGGNVCASEVGSIIAELVEALESRSRENFIGIQTKTVLKKFVESLEISESKFFSEVKKFYSTAIDYLLVWSKPFADLKHFSWIHLSAEPLWCDVENTLEFMKDHQALMINDCELFDEFQCLLKYVTLEKIEEWNTNNYDASFRWTELLSNFSKKNVSFVNLLKIIEFALCLPGSSAPVERVFSLMNNIWTPEKGRMKVETVAALLTVQMNIKLNCLEYYELIKSETTLLEKVHSVEKYS